MKRYFFLLLLLNSTLLYNCKAQPVADKDAADAIAKVLSSDTSITPVFAECLRNLQSDDLSKFDAAVACLHQNSRSDLIALALKRHGAYVLLKASGSLIDISTRKELPALVTALRANLLTEYIGGKSHEKMKEDTRRNLILAIKSALG